MQGQSVLQRNIPPVLLATIAIVALMAVGQWLQSQVHLNHDVSWFVHFSGWLLQGRTLGSDAVVLGHGTEKWIPGLPALWILCFYAIARFALEPIGSVLMALGRVNLLLKATLVAAVVELGLTLPRLTVLWTQGNCMRCNRCLYFSVFNLFSDFKERP